MAKYDIIVIGSGPGGYVAAIRASQLGMKVAVVEKAEIGGICLNWGCIPTKALLKSANVFEYITHAKDYGVEVKEFKADVPGMVKRSRDVAASNSKGVQFLFKKNKIELIEGAAKLKKGGKVEVDNGGKKSEHEAKHIIVATGGRSRELPNLKIDGKKIIGYREAMILDAAPKKLLVVGSGAIGVEFAYFYQAIGSEVTIVEFLPRIVPVEDEEVSKTLEKSFKKSGMTIHTSSEVTKVDTSGKGCIATVKTPTGEIKIEADIVLSAVGISANLEGIGLEEVGVKTEKGKVIVDDFYKTNVPGVYAIGDIVKGQALAHVASRRRNHLRRENRRSCNPRTDSIIKTFRVVLTAQPEIASVGYTRKKAARRRRDSKIKVGKFPFSCIG